MDSAHFPLCSFDHIMPRRYTFRLFFFPMAETHDATTIETTLRLGLSSMMEAMPLLSGTLKPQYHPSQSGRLAITAPWNSIDDIFRVKDLSHHDINYEELRRRHFPMDAFEFEDILSIAAERSDTFGLENPVILAQLNFLKGGFILGVCMHHSVLDGQAAVPLMQIWAAHCRGEQSSNSRKQELLSRAPLLRQTSSEATLEDFYEYVFQSPDNEKPRSNDITSNSIAAEPQSWWQSIFYFPRLLLSSANHFSSLLLSNIYKSSVLKVSTNLEVETDIFFFPSYALRKLKILASPFQKTDSDPDWISTNDALAALCYCCITSARTPHPRDPFAEIELAQTLDGRRLIHPALPQDFLGNVSLFCQISSSFNSLQPSIKNISNLALRIRRRINEIDTAYADNLLSALENVPDISTVVPSFAGGPHKGMMVSSWRQQTFSTVDWGSGIGARVERMRLPKMRFARYEGVCIVLPEGKEQGEGSEDEKGWEVMVGLYPEAMERLKRDEFWGKFSTWRCRWRWEKEMREGGGILLAVKLYFFYFNREGREFGVPVGLIELDRIESDFVGWYINTPKKYMKRLKIRRFYSSTMTAWGPRKRRQMKKWHWWSLLSKEEIFIHQILYQFHSGRKEEQIKETAPVALSPLREIPRGSRRFCVHSLIRFLIPQMKSCSRTGLDLILFLMKWWVTKYEAWNENYELYV